MIRVILGLVLFNSFFLSSFLFAGKLANEKEFLKMCNDPSPSQKITLEAIAKSNLIQIDKDMCININRRFIIIEIGHLKAFDNNITDLTPLLFFPHLTSLYLSRNNIKDISILKHLTKLKELDLSNNPVSDLSALKDLKFLKQLNIYNTNVTNLSPLNSIKTLKSLSYSNHKRTVFDASEIKDLRNLKYLGLGHIKIKNFCMMNNFINLERFSPTNTTTNEDLNCLTKLKNLDILRLNDNTQITNIDFVLNFPKLGSLSIHNTKVRNIDILKDVHTLKYLGIKDTPIKDVSVLAGRQNFTLNAYESPFIDTPFLSNLTWCSPKNTQDLRDGKSCLNKDGTLKPFWKRIFGL